MAAQGVLPARRRSTSERGSTAIELAILAPIFLLIVFFIIQAGLFFYGRNVAVQAAREGVSQLRLAEDVETYEAIRDQVVLDTRYFAGQVGRQSLTNPQVETGYDDAAARVQVTVTGEVISLVPGLNLTTSASASGSVERYSAPAEP